MRGSATLGWVTAVCALTLAAGAHNARAQGSGTITGAVTGGPSATPLWDIPVQFVLTVTGPVAASVPTSSRLLSAVVTSGTYSLTVAAQNACGVSEPTATQVVSVP